MKTFAAFSMQRKKFETVESIVGKGKMMKVINVSISLFP